jgi:hypothetical protein
MAKLPRLNLSRPFHQRRLPPHAPLRILRPRNSLGQSPPPALTPPAQQLCPGDRKRKFCAQLGHAALQRRLALLGGAEFGVMGGGGGRQLLLGI